MRLNHQIVILFWVVSLAPILWPHFSARSQGFNVVQPAQNSQETSQNPDQNSQNPNVPQTILINPSGAQVPLEIKLPPQLDSEKPGNTVMVPKAEFSENVKKLQSVLKKFDQPQLLEGVKQLGEHPHLKTFIITEILLFIGFLFFRSWRFSKIPREKWLARVWAGSWTFGVYWVFASLIVPSFLLGKAFSLLIQGFSEALLF